VINVSPVSTTKNLSVHEESKDMTFLTSVSSTNFLVVHMIEPEVSPTSLTFVEFLGLAY